MSPSLRGGHSILTARERLGEESRQSSGSFALLLARLTLHLDVQCIRQRLSSAFDEALDAVRNENTDDPRRNLANGLHRTRLLMKSCDVGRHKGAVAHCLSHYLFFHIRNATNATTNDVAKAARLLAFTCTTSHQGSRAGQPRIKPRPLALPLLPNEPDNPVGDEKSNNPARDALEHFHSHSFACLSPSIRVCGTNRTVLGSLLATAFVDGSPTSSCPCRAARPMRPPGSRRRRERPSSLPSRSSPPAR